jgi:hypothetical protein
MATVMGYCVKDRKKTEMVGAKEVKMKGGRLAMTGTCANCGTKMFRIMGKAK